MKSTKEEFAPEAFCPVKQTIRLLGKRWTILLIKEIFYAPEKKLGFMGLRRRLPDISTKVLSQRLKEMVGESLLKRKVHAGETPIRVDYSLTPKGKEACDIIEEFKKYGLKWGGKETFDCTHMDCEMCAKKRADKLD